MMKGLRYTVKRNKQLVKVSCFFKSKNIGWAYLKITGDYLTPNDEPLRESIFVLEGFRRNKIASTMYSLAEKRIKKTLIPSGHQSPDAKKLWSQKNRPFGN